MRKTLTRFFFFLLPVFCSTLCSAQEAGRAAFQKVCGQCHPREFVMAPRTKARWEETIQKMVGLGAKASDAELTDILDYLVKTKSTDVVSIQVGVGEGTRPKRIPGGEAGPSDKHIVDLAAAVRGSKIWTADCMTCHGVQARGTAQGPSLIRSELVLRDRNDNEIAAYMRKSHPNATAFTKLKQEQFDDLSHFIHQQVYDTLRESLHVQDVVVGDAAAGKAFFNGEGKCATCHSPTGDLAGLGSRYDAASIQGRFLSPRGPGRGPDGKSRPNARQVTLTVTAPSGEEVTGRIVHLDDFTVAVRDAQGDYHSWTRTSSLKVVKNDPYAVHDELLPKYTDKNMHDIVAYLVTLK